VPNGAGCVGVVNSTNITMKDLRLTKNGFGILLVYSKDSRIENINTRDNDYGIYLKHSSSNMLINNNASNNKCGIYLSSSSNNALTNNSALNNWEGIDLSYSNSNTLTINKAISNNYKGIFLWFGGQIMISPTQPDKPPMADISWQGVLGLTVLWWGCMAHNDLC